MIFMWTPPHFWALALYRTRDYARAGVPMLPVVPGPDETRKQIVIYSALLVPLALAPAFIGLGGPLYALAAIVLGGIFLALALNVYQRARAARRTGPPGSCSPSPSSTCSGCLPCFSSSGASARLAA